MRFDCACDLGQNLCKATSRPRGFNEKHSTNYQIILYYVNKIRNYQRKSVLITEAFYCFPSNFL